MSRSPQYYVYINSDEWREKCKRCHGLTKHHCVVFPWAKSRNVHHLTYRNFQKEIPLCDTVPLSKFAHWIIHLWIFWKTPLRPWVNFLLRLLLIFWAVIWFFIPVSRHNKRHKKYA
ncbi:MAG TPA: hypothetical protein VE944_28925 [Nostoc sp.]|uniref:hypothetical protein n=1 Tax=Nostoc sp. TaxID=1180 RepID=UPI002D497DB6|nr:hypothetical protein [Nostoc sp.]HYX18318.1 hypothetical protein [Nostoc sp.]